MKEQGEYDKSLLRVGVAPLDRLAWVCRLVNDYRTQGATWRPGEFDNAQGELAVFCGIGDTFPGWGGTRLEHGVIAERPSQPEAVGILAHMQRMLEDTVRRKPIIPTRFRSTHEFRWKADEGRYRPYDKWDETDMDRSTWDDRVQYPLAHLLYEECDRVSRCPAKLAHEETECGAFFLRTQRQKYCSKSCTAREMARAKRQRDSQPTRTRSKKGGLHGAKTR